jgi:hypothetical protein
MVDRTSFNRVLGPHLLPLPIYPEVSGQQKLLFLFNRSLSCHILQIGATPRTFPNGPMPIQAFDRPEEPQERTDIFGHLIAVLGQQKQRVDNLPNRNHRSITGSFISGSIRSPKFLLLTYPPSLSLSLRESCPQNGFPGHLTFRLFSCGSPHRTIGNSGPPILGDPSVSSFEWQPFMADRDRSLR